MSFPRDFGAHPGFRTEWWYVTGWLGEDHGFQVTFFRVRTTHPQENPSRFAPTQLLFAHAALMLPKNRHALHAQRAARAGLSGARFSMQDADVAIGDWWLKRAADDRYRTVVRDGELEFDLTLAPPNPPGDPRNAPWLQDLRGFSRKGPRPEQASHYYSRPQLRVSGTANGEAVSGVAWFDHEWSTTYLDPAADGWDWTGINLDDGGALVAFRIRPRQPGPDLWRYCALRHPDGRIERFDDVQFEVLRSWQSPRTSTRYPVSIGLVLPRRRLRLEPLFDDQELDGRGSTGTIYWEGAVRVLDEGGKRLGRGYLELTGYQSPLKM
jgi:predicted secreted hydrolase